MSTIDEPTNEIYLHSMDTQGLIATPAPGENLAGARLETDMTNSNYTWFPRRSGLTCNEDPFTLASEHIRRSIENDEVRPSRRDGRHTFLSFEDVVAMTALDYLPPSDLNNATKIPALTRYFSEERVTQIQDALLTNQIQSGLGKWTLENMLRIHDVLIEKRMEYLNCLCREHERQLIADESEERSYLTLRSTDAMLPLYGAYRFEYDDTADILIILPRSDDWGNYRIPDSGARFWLQIGDTEEEDNWRSKVVVGIVTVSVSEEDEGEFELHFVPHGSSSEIDVPHPFNATLAWDFEGLHPCFGIEPEDDNDTVTEEAYFVKVVHPNLEESQVKLATSLVDPASAVTSTSSTVQVEQEVEITYAPAPPDLPVTKTPKVDPDYERRKLRYRLQKLLYCSTQRYLASRKPRKPKNHRYNAKMRASAKRSAHVQNKRWARPLGARHR